MKYESAVKSPTGQWMRAEFKSKKQRDKYEGVTNLSDVPADIKFTLSMLRRVEEGKSAFKFAGPSIKS